FCCSLPVCCLRVLTLRPPGSTLFPCTTLFRSGARASPRFEHRLAVALSRIRRGARGPGRVFRRVQGRDADLERRGRREILGQDRDRKSTRLNSSHEWISYAVFCLKKKRKNSEP